MKRALVRYRNSAFRQFLRRHKKYAPIYFFIGGFIFDTLTLGRVDRAYDLTVLCLHMVNLTVIIYLFNLADDGKWKNTFLDRFEEYFPLAIQFFFGALSSAYVIYFSRSVSLSKTVSFFIILIVLLFANEFLKKRISNKYLQFSVYAFINFTYCSFMIPVFIREMSTEIFIVSGLVSFGITLTLIGVTYTASPSTRKEITLWKVIGLVGIIYITLNFFYFFRLIPPVPLALDTGIVAHNIKVEDGNYIVSYEADDSHIFWRDHRLNFVLEPEEEVYIFSSIFAPTSLEKEVFHRWKWYNKETEDWEIVEDIGFEIVGGRDGGFRGYTYKSNVWQGTWKVEVMTEEELVLGVIDFNLIISENLEPKKLVVKRF